MSYKTKIIIGNKELLMRAIVNIMSNAVDYSPTKSEIEFVVSEKEGMFIFTIRDSGRGLRVDSKMPQVNFMWKQMKEKLENIMVWDCILQNP